MKTLLVRLWSDQNFFIGAVCTLAVTALQIVSLPDYIEIPLTPLLTGGAFAHLRTKTTPVKPRR